MLWGLYGIRSERGYRKFSGNKPRRDLRSLCCFLQTRLEDDGFGQEVVLSGNHHLAFGDWQSGIASLIRKIELTLAEMEIMGPGSSMSPGNPKPKSMWDGHMGDEIERWELSARQMSTEGPRY